MKKYIILASLVAVILVVVGVSASTSNNEEAAVTVASSLVLATDSYDFGTIDIFGGKVATDFTLKNTGTEDVQVLSAVTSCMCTTGVIDDLQFSMHGSTGDVITVPAGGEKTLTAVYDPLAHGPNGTGRITRELMLETNSTETPDLRARIAANVVKNN